jgi:hypothetical protein
MAPRARAGGNAWHAGLSHGLLFGCWFPLRSQTLTVGETECANVGVALPGTGPHGRASVEEGWVEPIRRALKAGPKPRLQPIPNGETIGLGRKAKRPRAEALWIWNSTFFAT